MAMRTLQHLTDLARDEQGASFLEVILLAIIIALAAFAGMGFLGETSDNRPNNVSTAVT